MNMIEQIRQLGLPPRSFVVVGSGTLAALGLRKANDIDLLVTPEIYEQLKAAGWKEHTYVSTKDTGLSRGDFEVVTSWHGATLRDLIDSAVWFERIPFAHPEDVITYKTDLAREKDVHDVALMHNYLANQHHMGNKAPFRHRPQ